MNSNDIIYFVLLNFSWSFQSICCIWFSTFYFCWPANGFHYCWICHWLHTMYSGEFSMRIPLEWTFFSFRHTNFMFDIQFRYKNRPVMSGPGLYDPTSIMNAGKFNFFTFITTLRMWSPWIWPRNVIFIYVFFISTDTLSKCQREGWIKLAVYLLSFFYYLYGYVIDLHLTSFFDSFIHHRI